MLAEIERCLKRLYSYLVKSDLADDDQETHDEKGIINVEKKTICKFSPVRQAKQCLKILELGFMEHFFCSM